MALEVDPVKLKLSLAFKNIQNNALFLWFLSILFYCFVSSAVFVGLFLNFAVTSEMSMKRIFKLKVVLQES